MIQRLNANPILSPSDLKPTDNDLEVLSTFNPGAIRKDNEIILVVRVAERPIPEEGYVSTIIFNAVSGENEVIRFRLDDPDVDTTDSRAILYKGRPVLTSLSHLRLARSTDGKSFTFDPEPFIVPTESYEAYGCEDARITYINGRYYINYSVISNWGICTAMSVSDDLKTSVKLGIVLTTHNKDMCLFPEKVNDMYVCRHRPHSSRFNTPNMWTAYSPDLLSWGQHTLSMKPTPGTWYSERVGGGAPPVKTDEGWLEIFHAADDSGRYCLGAMLSDLEKPEKILAYSSKPVFQPEADYEITGLYGNCVFSNGMIADPDGTLTIYYGAADSICAAAVTTIDEMIKAAKS